MTQIKSAKIRFPNGNEANVLRVPIYADLKPVVEALGFHSPRPAIFLTGGASAMSEAEIQKTRRLVDEGIARFAAENNIAVIDGGTEAGIMQMIGEARAKHHYSFPLIGSAPLGKVLPPNATPAADSDRTPLESNHSQFVLVEADYWGAESDMIVGLARTISGGVMPMVGILINGGTIAQYDVFIATARGTEAAPIIVVDGSGRTADSIASATKTGKFMNAMIRAIIEGGKIDIVHLESGPGAMFEKLVSIFGTQKR